MNEKALIGKNLKEDRFSISQLVFFGVLLLIVFTVLNTSKYGASLSWVIVPCAIILLGWALTTKKEIFTVHYEIIFLFAFWFLFLFSTIFSNIVTLERDIVTFFIFCLVYVSATSYNYDKKQISIIILLHTLVALYAELNILYNFATDNFYSEWFKRSSFSFLGVYKDPNYVMAFIAPAIAIQFIRLINAKNKWQRIFCLTFLIVSILAIFATGSRTPMLVLAIFFIAYFIMPSGMGLTKRIAVLSVVGVIGVLAIYIVFNYYSEQAIDRLFNFSGDSRWAIWAQSLKVFEEYPIFGAGMSAASTVSQFTVGKDSHNVYIDILCNSGIFGLTIFLIFVYKSCLKTNKSNKVFVYSLFLTFMIPLFFINGFNTATFYTPLILMSIISKYCSKEESSYLDLL